MKTIITTLILIFICASGTITTGQDIALEDEAYVDDIPFNTELIAYQSMVSDMISEDIESYVDDIPFNTKKIYYESLANNMATAWANETNVDDIPFSTRDIYCMNRPCLVPQGNLLVNGVNDIAPVEYHSANFILSPVTPEFIRTLYHGNNLMYYQLDSKTENCKTSEYQIESFLAD